MIKAHIEHSVAHYPWTVVREVIITCILNNETVQIESHIDSYDDECFCLASYMTEYLTLSDLTGMYKWLRQKIVIVRSGILRLLQILEQHFGENSACI